MAVNSKINVIEQRTSRSPDTKEDRNKYQAEIRRSDMTVR